jgi:hypothetical protein
MPFGCMDVTVLHVGYRHALATCGDLRMVRTGIQIYSWFQTFAVFRMSYAFFWVIPRRLNFICRHFGTLHLFHLHRRIGVEWLCLTHSDPTSDLVWQYDFRVLLRCRKMSDIVFVAFVRPLSEPVRCFSSCSTDFSQQIAQVVLFLFLHVFLF